MNAAALLLALGSAVLFGLSSAVQQRAAKQEKRTTSLDPRLLVRLLRRPMWLLSWPLDTAGTGLQALALRVGPLALVQPVLASGLFLAIPLEAAINRSRAHPRDLVAGAIGVIGLATFLVAAQPRQGVSDPSARAWLGVALGSGTAVAICLALATRATNAARGALLGVATGLFYSNTAAQLKPVTTKLAQDPLSVLTGWHLYVLAVLGLTGLLLNQNAFQSGRIAAPLTAITMVDPVTSVLIAVTAFHEKLDVSGPRLVIELAAAAVMASGIWLASTRRHVRAGR